MDEVLVEKHTAMKHTSFCNFFDVVLTNAHVISLFFRNGGQTARSRTIHRNAFLIRIRPIVIAVIGPWLIGLKKLYSIWVSEFKVVFMVFIRKWMFILIDVLIIYMYVNLFWLYLDYFWDLFAYIINVMNIVHYFFDWWLEIKRFFRICDKFILTESLGNQEHTYEN